MKDIINKIKVFLGIDVSEESKSVSKREESEYNHFIQRFSRKS
jgi:hypothetical protein